MLDEEYYKIAKDALKRYNLKYDEDILQEIVTCMVEKESLYDASRGQLSTFMYQVVRNKYYEIKNLSKAQKRGCGDKPISFDTDIDSSGHTILDVVGKDSSAVYNRIKKEVLDEILPLVDEPLKLWLEGMTQCEIQVKLGFSSQSQVSISINRNIVNIKRYCKRNKIEFKLKEDN